MSQNVIEECAAVIHIHIIARGFKLTIAKPTSAA